MTFLAPWALAIGAMAAAGMVLLHLVARQRPAAYVLPTTRFIPDQRTLVSRMASRPRDLLLLALRVLLLLTASAAFARPVLTPTRGAIARIVLLDRSRAVANAADAVTRARALVTDGAPRTVIAFDSIPTVLAQPAWDSLASAPRVEVVGSLSAALIAARRASGALAERADSVVLSVVSPIAASEIDSATRLLRAQWPGALRVERVPLRADSSATWQLERALPLDDPLGPAMAALHGTLVTRLVRGSVSRADSAFARAGGTVVRWDSVSATRPVPEGLAVGNDVIVAALGRIAVPNAGRAIARWADGSAAASESPIGAGCIRTVGVALPAAGDIALHPPFQRIARSLLVPCGIPVAEQGADSAVMAGLTGATSSAARSDDLRRDDERSSPLARWLLAAAILLAVAVLFVRAAGAPDEI